MERLSLLVFLGLVCSSTQTESSVLNPRGARPVEHGTRSEKCAAEKEWPFCSDDEWGPKCPSGCRIQGLMDKYDHGMLKKIEKIRTILDQNKAKHSSADQGSKQTYSYLKERLILDTDNDNNYYDLSNRLRQRITDMKMKIDQQLKILAAMNDRVKEQVAEMQKLEVDIDIKLRSCKGSCKSYFEYQVDGKSYEELDKQIKQLDSQEAQESVGTLYVMKSRPIIAAATSHTFKSKDVHTVVEAQKLDDVFAEVKTAELILEYEGSPASPASISKVPGTSFSPSASSVSTSTSSKSITEFGGSSDIDLFGGNKGFDAFSQSGTSHSTVKTVSCTRTIKKVIVHGKDGPEEKEEVVVEGGPECHDMTHDTKGGLASLFPSLSQQSFSSSSSSSSSSSTTKTIQTGGTKGLLDDFKTGFGNPFADDDLGAFRRDDAEEDLPDFHARSVKSVRTERQADYVGKDCVEAHQNHLKGETNGLFKIKPGGTDSVKVVEVYCEQEGLMGGWLLVQQRDSGALSFNRSWADYRGGFGSVDATGRGEVWLGNQNLHLLTSQGETMLKVELEDWEGGAASAEYIVRVGSEEEGYPLHVSSYSGDAGDALLTPKSDMASYLTHSGMKFSTFDKDNDRWEENCAEMYGGGWWYNNCQAANLNGVYYKGAYDPEKNSPYEVENGVVWLTYKPATYSLKTVRMFIRTVAF